jgi:hypothetical protein
MAGALILICQEKHGHFVVFAIAEDVKFLPLKTGEHNFTFT